MTPGSPRSGHIVRSKYTMLNVTCARCEMPWEQPVIDPDDIGWIVCPHCNHPAETFVAECHKGALS